MVSPSGFEPETYLLKVSCSTGCATGSLRADDKPGIERRSIRSSQLFQRAHLQRLRQFGWLDKSEVTKNNSRLQSIGWHEGRCSRALYCRSEAASGGPRLNPQGDVDVGFCPASGENRSLWHGTRSEFLLRAPKTIRTRPRRGVAQPGRAPALGAGCRRFESSRPDHFGDCLGRGPSRRGIRIDGAGTHIQAGKDGNAIGRAQPQMGPRL